MRRAVRAGTLVWTSYASLLSSSRSEPVSTFCSRGFLSNRFSLQYLRGFHRSKYGSRYTFPVFSCQCRFCVSYTVDANICATSRWRACRDANLDIQDPLSVAQDTFSALASKGRSWRRLRHLVELACSNSTGSERIRTVADIGCDHGLLAMALAVSGRFDSVVGVDVSERALNNGAIALRKQVFDAIGHNPLWTSQQGNSTDSIFPIDFRVGNGLQPIIAGEADALCIAGMGINTMLRILLEPVGSENVTQLERVASRRLILQPTNSRPRNLIKLYDSLHGSGWGLADERIEMLSSRWYISASFARSDGASDGAVKGALPGSILSLLAPEDPMRQTYDLYVRHHKRWLLKDRTLSGQLSEEDQEWLDHTSSRLVLLITQEEGHENRYTFKKK